MRTSEYYGVQVPELGDRADITVVSQAIIDSEDNQSGKVENMKATLSGSTISLVSESRADKLVKYYNGLAVQFISPVNAQAGTAYKIKVDNLAEQPYNNKVDIKVGDIVQAIYGSTGFVSANTPIPRSSSTSSSSEVTVATSLAVKNANDNANNRALKTTQIIAGNGLIGGGSLDANRTINVASADDSITVGADNIKVNTYNGVDGTSTTRPGSARAVKMSYDKGKEALDKANTKLDAGSVSTEYNTAKKIEDKIKEKIDKVAIVNDLTTGGTDKVGSAEMVKKLGEDKQDKTDSGLQTDSKEVVGAINESLWHTKAKSLDEMAGSGSIDILEVALNPGVYRAQSSSSGVIGLPESVVGKSVSLNVMGTNGEENQNYRQYMLFPRDYDAIFYNRKSSQWQGWSEILTDKSKVFLGNSGISKVTYIQDVGQKTRGNGYIDKTTGKLYICMPKNPSVNTVSDVTVTGNFTLATNVSNAKKISDLTIIKQTGASESAGNYKIKVYDCGLFYYVLGKLYRAYRDSEAVVNIGSYIPEAISSSNTGYIPATSIINNSNEQFALALKLSDGTINVWTNTPYDAANFFTLVIPKNIPNF